jgi:hypothetical protein
MVACRQQQHGQMNNHNMSPNNTAPACVPLERSAMVACRQQQHEQMEVAEKTPTVCSQHVITAHTSAPAQQSHPSKAARLYCLKKNPTCTN